MKTLGDPGADEFEDEESEEGVMDEDVGEEAELLVDAEADADTYAVALTLEEATEMMAEACAGEIVSVLVAPELVAG